MPAAWHTLLLAPPLAAPATADALLAALGAHGWQRYDPFGAPGATYTQRVRAFVLPTADGAPWAQVVLADPAPSDVLAALSQAHVLLAASAHHATHAALVRWAQGAALPLPLPDVAAHAPGAEASPLPTHLLPDDVRTMAQTLDARTVNGLFARVLGSAFGRAGADAGAAGKAQAHLAASAPLAPDAPSLRALAAGLAQQNAPVTVGVPTFEALRDAYAVAARLARGARLLPGEADALAAVPEAFARACAPVFAGRA